MPAAAALRWYVLSQYTVHLRPLTNQLAAGGASVNNFQRITNDVVDPSTKAYMTWPYFVSPLD
jgi:hypothetical protein